MSELLNFIVIVGGTALLSWPLGAFLAGILTPSTSLRGFRSGLERAFAWIGGPLAQQSQDWKRYLAAMLGFNLLMFVTVFAILLFQQWLPLNPDHKGSLSWDLIFNTAASFTTNTNLQHYSGDDICTLRLQLFK